MLTSATATLFHASHILYSSYCLLEARNLFMAGSEKMVRAVLNRVQVSAGLADEVRLIYGSII
jgi:hypothetical protein